MITGESSLNSGKSVTTISRKAGKVRFMGYVSSLLGAFLHPDPTLVIAASRHPVLAPVMFTNRPETIPHLPNGSSGGAPKGHSQREPALVNRALARRIHNSGRARVGGFALVGGSLDARLSHRPGRRGEAAEGTAP